MCLSQWLKIWRKAEVIIIKKLIIIAIVLAIASPAVALIWEPHTQGFAGCPGSGQVIWEFTEPGCMPTSDVADPPYFFDPCLPDPVFGTSYATSGGPVAGWTWSDGVYTISDEDGLNQPIPDRGGKQYLRMYYEIVHTMVEGDDPSFIGMGMELWNRLDWPGCPEGANFIGEFDGIWFPTPTETFDLGGGWHQTYWMFDFSTDGSVGTQTFPGLHEATHTTFLIGMLDFTDFSVTPFDIEEAYINYIWYNNADGSDIPEGPCLPPIYTCCFTCVSEEGETTDDLGVYLKWKPSDDVIITIDPNMDGDDPHEEFIIVDSIAPDGSITLTFEPNSWDTHQVVTFKAIDDDEKEKDQYYDTILITSESTDPPFNGVELNKSIKVIDDDDPEILVSVDRIMLSENDPCIQECFEIVCSHLPDGGADVEVSIAAEGLAAEGGMFVINPPLGVMDEPNHLTFTSTMHQVWDPCTMTSGWNVPQTICTYAVDNDELAQAWLENVPADITFTPRSNDHWYNWTGFGGMLAEETVHISVEDNECGAWGYSPA
ncbi:MAG: hypothetical protein ACYS32_04565, partial [Planctomycetota bacterium]